MVLNYARRIRDEDWYLSLDGERLLKHNSYDYLGIRLDSKLTFENHIEKLITSCNQQLFHFSKIDVKTAVTIYKSTYCRVCSMCV